MSLKWDPDPQHWFYHSHILSLGRIRLHNAGSTVSIACCQGPDPSPPSALALSISCCLRAGSGSTALAPSIACCLGAGSGSITQVLSIACCFRAGSGSTILDLSCACCLGGGGGCILLRNTSAIYRTLYLNYSCFLSSFLLSFCLFPPGTPLLHCQRMSFKFLNKATNIL